MNEEVEIAKRDWKAAQILEYARLENEIAIEKQSMAYDPQLINLNKKQAKVNEMIEMGEKQYLKNIEIAQQQQTGIKAELVDRWYSEDKTFECAAGTATLRTTKSLNIRNKEKLISKLRKIKDVGLLGDEIASYDEKKSIAIKIAEVEQ